MPCVESSKTAGVDLLAAFVTAAVPAETPHMTPPAYAATAFLVARGGQPVWLLWDRQNPFHRNALALALTVGRVASLLQPLSADPQR